MNHTGPLRARLARVLEAVGTLADPWFWLPTGNSSVPPRWAFWRRKHSPDTPKWPRPRWIAARRNDLIQALRAKGAVATPYGTHGILIGRAGAVSHRAAVIRDHPPWGGPGWGWRDADGTWTPIAPISTEASRIADLIAGQIGVPQSAYLPPFDYGDG